MSADDTGWKTRHKGTRGMATTPARCTVTMERLSSAIVAGRDEASERFDDQATIQATVARTNIFA